MRIRIPDLRLLTVMQRTDGTDTPREQRVDWFWTASAWEGSPEIREPRKCDGLDWFDLAALPEVMPDYERLVLEGWRDGSLPLASAHGFAS